MFRTLSCSLLVVAMLDAALLAGTTFTSTWKAPEAAQARFAGKKVVALVISDDQGVRVSGEEGLVRELTARGLKAVAAYRLIPKEEVKDPEKARGWFERAGVEGVVAMRPVSADKVRTYEPATWAAPGYSTLWGYYGYGWGGVYDLGYVRENTVVVIETLIFSVPMNKLLWAATSETKNPKTQSTLLADLVKEATKEMKKQGLTRAATD